MGATEQSKAQEILQLKADCFDLMKKQAGLADESRRLAQEQNTKARKIQELEKKDNA